MSDRDSRFVGIYERHYRSVHAYCRRRVDADRVDDVVAETFLAAWRKIDAMPREQDALPWLYATAYRVLMHQWRGASRMKRLEARLRSVDTSVAAPPDELIVLGDDARRATEALTALKPIDQEILRLVLWEELTHSQTAEIVGMKTDAVRQRYSRALKTLTKEYNKLLKGRSLPALLKKGGVL